MTDQDEADALLLVAAEEQIARLQAAQMTLPAPAAYLATLQSKESRRTAIESFQRIAKVLHISNYNYVPWEKIDFSFANMIRTKLAISYHPRTGNLTLSALRGVLLTAAILKRIPFDQYQIVKSGVKAIKGSRLITGRALSNEEIKLFRDFCLRQSPIRATMLRGLIAVMIGAGFRREEVCRSRITDYDFAGTITAIGKGNKERRVPMDKYSSLELEIWLTTRKMLDLNHDFIFVTIRSDDKIIHSPITKWSLWNLLSKLCSELIKEDETFRSFSPHDLRRTFATRLLDSGVPLKTVQALMGHAFSSTTLIYDKKEEKEIAIQRRKIDILGLKDDI